MGVLPLWSADEAGEEGVGEEEIRLVAGQQEESEKDQRCAGQGHVLVEVEVLHEPGLRVALGPEAVDEECGGDQEAEEAERRDVGPEADDHHQGGDQEEDSGGEHHGAAAGIRLASRTWVMAAVAVRWPIPPPTKTRANRIRPMRMMIST